MMTHRFTGLAAGLVSGIVLASQTNVSLHPLWLVLCVLIGITVTAAGVWAERRWKEWPRSMLFLAAFLLALPFGYFRTNQALIPQHPSSLRSKLETFEEGDRIRIRGNISSEPEWRGHGQVDLTVRVQAIRAASEEDWTPVGQGLALVRVFAYSSNRPETFDYLNELASPSAYGYQIEFTAPYRPISPPLNPAQFDYQRFLRQSGIETSLRSHATRVEILERSRGFWLTELALATKLRFIETFKRTIRSPASRIAAAATLGARRSVERIPYRGHDIAEMFRHAGVGHVLAVSGLHVSVIAVLLFALFRMTGTQPRVFVPPLIFFLILFAILTGARPSSVRAVVMNSVILFTIAYFRCDLRTATAIGLSASAFVILLHNPLILFAPSFLLSYGAVLSLIVLAPPFDRFLCTLRGFSAIFFLVWFSLLLGLAGWRLHWLTTPGNLLALGGALWLAILAGGSLNNRFPRMWNTGIARLPPLLRIFLAAQLAIQIGMMIPLSAWFFGRFPVAGVLVNLLAIPAVGILVQLGMLVGLVGLIPWLGAFLTPPLGAATSIVGEIFLLIAYVGATLFPFPSTPQPTMLHLTIYYAIVGIILGVEQNRNLLLDWLYRMRPDHTRSRAVSRIAMIAIPTLLLLSPLLHWKAPQPTASRINVLAVSRYPVITITGQRQADIINAGGRLDGQRLLFDTLRAEGATRIRHAILPAPDPRAGIEGVTALAPLMPIQQILMPQLPAPDESFATMLGDDYLIERARNGVPWARNYDEAFERLRTYARGASHQTALIPFAQKTTPLAEWSNIRISPLPVADQQPERFLTSALTPLLHADVHGLSWVIITDTLPEALPYALEAVPQADVLVVSDLGRRTAFYRWLRDAIEHLQPRILIVGGNAPIDWNDRQLDWLTSLEAHGLPIFRTGVDGAVQARLLPGPTTAFQTHISQRKLSLSPLDPDPTP